MKSKNLSKIAEYKEFIKDKKVLIFGLGLQGGGVDAAKFFCQNNAQVCVTDLRTEKELAKSIDQLKNYSINYVLGKNQKEDIFWADIILVNPDIWNKNLHNDLIEEAVSLGKNVETGMALFAELSGCPLIGITGTRGKTTTTTMINKVLKAAGFRTVFGGNIPDSANLGALKKTYKADFAVLELSNYQLHGFHLKKISPHIAIVKNIYPDHLLSYPSMKAYVKDKTAICRYQKASDYLVLNKDNSWNKEFEKNYPGKLFYFNKEDLPESWQLKIPGDHNRANAAAALKVAQILKIDKNIIRKTLTSFKGVPFRLEKVAIKNGITFINDTTSTTPTAAITALKSFPKDKIILIAGGNSKNLPIDEFAKIVAERVKHLVLLEGSGTEEFKKETRRYYPSSGSRALSREKSRSSRSPSPPTQNSVRTTRVWNNVFLGQFSNLKKAIQKAYQNSQKGDIILFSPGFSSFAMWDNEFERGREFNKIVRKS